MPGAGHFEGCLLNLYRK